MAYRYVKATLKNPHPGRIIPSYLKVVPTIISALGLLIVAFVVFPLATYQLQDFNLTSLLPTNELDSPINYSVEATEDTGPKVLNQTDFTQASAWFPGSVQPGAFNQNTDSQNGKNLAGYVLSIPSLGIVGAEVSLVSEDLSQHLVHFPQTAIPGQLGSPVVFGHSSLPQLYDPQKYTTIFTNLPKVKPGANIITNYDGVEYTYKVTNTYEVKPSEIWVLQQDYSRRTIKVITCVPPGTTLKRLVVEGELIKN